MADPLEVAEFGFEGGPRRVSGVYQCTPGMNPHLAFTRQQRVYLARGARIAWLLPPCCMPPNDCLTSAVYCVLYPHGAHRVHNVLLLLYFPHKLCCERNNQTKMHGFHIFHVFQCVLRRLRPGRDGPDARRARRRGARRGGRVAGAGVGAPAHVTTLVNCSMFSALLSS